MKKIVVIGAGPTGLAAAYRLKELGYDNFIVYERNDYAGGLCSSFKDTKGFTWDLGGHVIFSHYKYVDRLFEKILGNGFLEHKRQAWIRTRRRWIPYPFQNNIRYLPKGVVKKCLSGLEKAERKKKKSANFREWILNNMGSGIAEYFMEPLNFKLWSYPLHLLSADWVAERVSPIKLAEVRASLKSGRDRTSWGPNATFKFPQRGGTGEIFRKMAAHLKNKIRFNSELTRIDAGKKKIYFSNRKRDPYDILINTSPLDKFIKLIEGCGNNLLNASCALKHNGVFVAGIGVSKPSPSEKSWIYFPDSNSPFFRVTYFSNYSPNNIPGDKEYYSLLCETSYSPHKKEKKSEVVKDTIQGLINSGILKESDKKSIASKFLFDIDYAYPIPTLKRDSALRVIQPKLQKMGIYSRGRFGAWKYEVGNTDHSVMQGKEAVDRILGRGKEAVWSL